MCAKDGNAVAAAVRSEIEEVRMALTPVGRSAGGGGLDKGIEAETVEFIIDLR